MEALKRLKIRHFTGFAVLLFRFLSLFLCAGAAPFSDFAPLFNDSRQSLNCSKGEFMFTKKEEGRKYMGQKIYFNFVNVRKYLREEKETGKRAVVSVTNRNALSVERHMELLNLNDEEHIYLECVEDNLL